MIKINHGKIIILMTKIVLAISFILILLCALFYRFYYSIDERIEQYFEKNKVSFYLLKEEVSSILNAGKVLPKDSIFVQISRDSLINSLKKKLDISEINFWIANDEIQEISFDIELNHFIGRFSYVYSDSPIKEFNTSDGIFLQQMKNNDNWGILRDKRRYGLIPVYE